MSSLAYFLSKDTIDLFNTIIKPIVYLSMFYFFNNPRSSIVDNYVILIALVYCVTGIGYTFAIFFQPGSAQLVPIQHSMLSALTNWGEMNEHPQLIVVWKLVPELFKVFWNQTHQLACPSDGSELDYFRHKMLQNTLISNRIFCQRSFRDRRTLEEFSEIKQHVS